MDIEIKGHCPGDLPEMLSIWNAVVEEGRAFPQLETLNLETGLDFFARQSHCGVARDRETGNAAGLYILHPNNVGRCGHICNASYAVARNMRGLGIGEKLVRDSLLKAKELGFGVMQFNAVAASNTPAHNLYKKLGFTGLGTIPGGFMRKDGVFEDIRLYFYKL